FKSQFFCSRNFHQNSLILLHVVNNFGVILYLTEKPCGKGWKRFGGSCYFLSNDTASWETGRDYCRNSGGDLVIVNSKEEQKFIAGFKRGSWIGLSDHEKEGIWKWVDGSPLTLSFWTPGQPNNGANNPVLGQQNCGEIFSKGKWNDVSCNNKLHWICEEMN
uniref:C-type lectin domain family 17, member A-like n=1 Tax=Sphaeramia orbicularis TaxID=375764 RepID=A0A672Y7R2_9TELE